MEDGACSTRSADGSSLARLPLGRAAIAATQSVAEEWMKHFPDVSDAAEFLERRQLASRLGRLHVSFVSPTEGGGGGGGGGWSNFFH